MKTYILLKDLPNAKAGTELNTDHAECPKNWYAFIDPRGQLVKFAAYDVENMPDWFKLKEEKAWTDSDMIEFARMIGGSDHGANHWFNNFKKLKNTTP